MSWQMAEFGKGVDLAQVKSVTNQASVYFILAKYLQLLKITESFKMMN